MLTYSFVDLGSDSLYEHLYKSIKNDIINGKLRAGDKLPSKRSFAKNLNISTITVENAYAQLMAEGYIYSIPKKGYFIFEVKSFKEAKAREKRETVLRKNPIILQILSATGPIMKISLFLSGQSWSVKWCPARVPPCFSRRRWAGFRSFGKPLQIICMPFGVLVYHRSRLLSVRERNISTDF